VDAKGDNAPAYNAIGVRQLLVKKEITALDHPPYSPDLATCDFLSLFRAKKCGERNLFSSSEEIKSTVTRDLKSLQEEEFTRCFRR